MWGVKTIQTLCISWHPPKTHLIYVVNVVATRRCCVGAMLFCRDVAVVVFLSNASMV
jgi:hypothetical protein